MRLNANQPRFDPACFYAREFWRRATAIEAGAFGEVLHLKREEHLAPAAAPLPIRPMLRPPPIAVATPPPYLGPIVIGPSALVPDGQRIVVDVAAQSIMIVRVGGVLRAFLSACPHYGVDLSDGSLDDAALYCPGCGVAFDLGSGQCRSRSLTLRPIEVTEAGGNILLMPVASHVLVSSDVPTPFFHRRLPAVGNHAIERLDRSAQSALRSARDRVLRRSCAEIAKPGRGVVAAHAGPLATAA